MSRRWFQVVNAVVALATVGLGTMQLVLGVDSPVYSAVQLPDLPALDSNLRFFGGMGLGLALMMLWSLPTIERRSDIVKVFWLCAFLGGIGRLISIPSVGAPPAPLVAFTVIEVVLAPVVVVWHSRIARTEDGH